MVSYHKSHTGYTKNSITPALILVVLPVPLPNLPKFDGAARSDPSSHIDSFTHAFTDYMHHDEVVLRLFPRTLGGEAVKWFNQLHEGSITTFQQLVDLFVQYFDIAKPFDTSLQALFSLNQGIDESNFDFMRRFRMLAYSFKTPFMGRELYDLFMNALRP